MADVAAPQLKKQVVVEKFKKLKTAYEVAVETHQGEAYTHYVDVAKALEKENQTEKVNEVRAALRALIELDQSLSARAQHLDQLKDTYECTQEATDFEALLQGRIAAAAGGSARVNVNQLEAMQEFEQAVWDVHHQGMPMPGQEDEEIAMVGAASEFKNVKCPLSGMNVHDLENPVQDQEGIIYDKQSITLYIRKKKGAVDCPQIGTSHKVRFEDLQPCHRLIREKKRRRLAETQGIKLSEGDSKNVELINDEDEFDLTGS